MTSRVKSGCPKWVDAVDVILGLDEGWTIAIGYDAGRSNTCLIASNGASSAYTNGTTPHDFAALMRFYAEAHSAPMLSTVDAAEQLGVPRNTLLSLLKRRKDLRPAKVGRSYGWTTDDIERVKPFLRGIG